MSVALLGDRSGHRSHRELDALRPAPLLGLEATVAETGGVDAVVGVRA